MNGWLAEYKAAAHRTRWISLLAAGLMVSAVARELISIYIGVSASEVPLQGDYAEAVMAQVGMLVFVGGSFILRVIFLLVFNPKRYSWIAVSWLVSCAAVVSYIWQTMPSYVPATTCGEGGQCFTIYSNARADWVALACFWFVLFSFLRALVTAVQAATRYRFRFR